MLICRKTGFRVKLLIMKFIFAFIFVLFSYSSDAQSLFNYNEIEVIKYLDGKEFFNSNYGLTLSYGYISRLNTYGITSVNSDGQRFYFINCNIKTFKNFADISGMSPTNGSNFGFRVFWNKLIVGYNETNQAVFYLKE